jgi:hypothetical protein
MRRARVAGLVHLPVHATEKSVEWIKRRCGSACLSGDRLNTSWSVDSAYNGFEKWCLRSSMGNSAPIPVISRYVGPRSFSLSFAVLSPPSSSCRPTFAAASVATEPFLASSSALYLRFDFLLADAFLLLLTSIFLATLDSSPFCRNSIFSAKICLAILWFWLLDRVA